MQASTATSSCCSMYTYTRIFKHCISECAAAGAAACADAMAYFAPPAAQIIIDAFTPADAVETRRHIRNLMQIGAILLLPDGIQMSQAGTLMVRLPAVLHADLQPDGVQQPDEPGHHADSVHAASCAVSSAMHQQQHVHESVD